MKVYLDNIIFSLQRNGGISTYWEELINYFIQFNNIEYIVQPEKNILSVNRTDKIIPARKVIEKRILPLRVYRYLPYNQTDTVNSIFHSSYYRFSKKNNIANIISVYDFIYEKYISGLPKTIHHYQKKEALKHADGVICISESTKRDLLYYFPNISEDKIRVIYLAPSDNFYPTKDTNLIEKYRLIPRWYVLFIGSRFGYKNFNIAIDVVSSFSNLNLVIVGGGKLTNPELEYLTSKLDDRFEHYKNIDKYTLNQLYNHAYCLLYPSSYEGFGIPVLEAMCAGCPVITSNTSSLPEICGDAGLMANDLSKEYLATLVRQLEDESYRSEVIKKGYKQASKFSWDKCAQETLKFYKDIYNYKF